MIVDETKMLLGFGHTLLVELPDLNGYKKLRNHWRMMINIPGVLPDSLSGCCLPSGVPLVCTWKRSNGTACTVAYPPHLHGPVRISGNFVPDHFHP